VTSPTADLHVVLVEPEIHWNTGNAGRTCLAAGAQLHLVAPLGFSLEDKEVRRAGLDYWPRVAPRLWPGWGEFERALPLLGTPYLFTARAERRFQAVPYAKPAVLIFGRESVGLDAAILARHAESTLAIPMVDRELRSLNLSTSVALALYEVRRQWGWP
jgi:tRNA (cytidine/uridine-2'-O-)-methyltransferase